MRELSIAVLFNLRRLSENNHGSTAIEYALIATLIAVVILGSVTILGSGVNNLFQNTADAM